MGYDSNAASICSFNSWLIRRYDSYLKRRPIVLDVRMESFSLKIDDEPP